MATDLYAKCPCGSGKKIKFCCRDIISDIEKIERMLRGEQRTAALEKIDKLLVKHPDRPALLSLKAQVFFELKRIEDAQPVVDQLLAIEPDNPTALAMRATLFAAEDDLQAALKSLHRALRMSDGVLSAMVYRAYITICAHLIQRQHIIAAFAHLLTLVSITRGEDRTSVSMLMNVTSSEKLPAIFQGLMISDECPDKVSWKREFDIAMDMYRHGDWSEAASMIESMNSRILDQPMLLRNLAILQAWTVQSEAAAKSFRRFATLRDVELERTVEAEACAQVLDAPAEEDVVELVALVQDIDDPDAMMERLLSVETVESVPVQRSSDDDVPPPKGQFIVFDKTEPDVNSDFRLEDLPSECGSITLFGRETDRSARITAVLFKDEAYETRLARLGECCGVMLNPTAETQTVGRLHKLARLLRANFRVPRGVSLERFNEIQREWFGQQLTTVWTTTEFSYLDGKSPADAAREKKLQKSVLAAILNLELWLDGQPMDFDANQLREQLGLPKSEPIDPSTVEVRRLSSTQLRLLELDKLSDDDLRFVFEVVSVRPNGSFLCRIGKEVLGRPSMEDKLDFLEVHERLADVAIDGDEQLEHLSKARDLAVSRGESPASWLINELDLRLGRGDLESAKRLISEIQARYLREPGIAQMFSGVLSKYGLMPRGPGATAGAMGADEAATVPAGAGVTRESGGIWTPDGESASPQHDGGGESKLWVPGME